MTKLETVEQFCLAIKEEMTPSKRITYVLSFILRQQNVNNMMDITPIF